MDNITERTNYLDKVSVDGLSQYDMGSLDFDSFDFGQVGYYRVKKIEEGRPDIISHRIYGTQNYWWFLMMFNNYSDIWNDLVENQVIRYPSIQKVRDFMKTRMRKVRDTRNDPKANV